MSEKKILIAIPTYNEASIIEKMGPKISSSNVGIPGNTFERTVIG